jgi:hypothetical protein
MLRAAGETETTQENIQDGLSWKETVDLNLTEEEITVVNFIFMSTTYIIKLSICFLSFFLSFRATFASLIQIIS